MTQNNTEWPRIKRAQKKKLRAYDVQAWRSLIMVFANFKFFPQVKCSISVINSSTSLNREQGGKSHWIFVTFSWFRIAEVNPKVSPWRSREIIRLGRNFFQVCAVNSRISIVLISFRRIIQQENNYISS